MNEERTLCVTDFISPELAQWWYNLSIYEREAIVFEAYSERKLDEMTNRVDLAIQDKLRELGDKYGK